MPRPSITAPKPPDRLTLASRENRVSPVKRPCTPVSAWKKEVSAKLAFRPPPRSSEPVMPNHEVVIPPLPTVALRAASPDIRMEPA